MNTTAEASETVSSNYDGIPTELKERDQWVAWRRERRDNDVTKVPVNPHTGTYASSADPDTWTTFDEAAAYHQSGDSDGLGFMFSKEGRLAGVDLDDVRDADTGRPTDTAKAIIERLDSYTEVSPSGTGYHIYVRGFVPGSNRSGFEDAAGHIEMYDKGRFFTVTGNHVDGTPARIERRADILQDIHNTHIADSDDNQNDLAGSVDAPEVDLNDKELIEKAMNAQNGEKFRQLWIGDTSGYKSHSEARQAFANLLAFWTGGDRGRMLALFKQSDLIRGEDDIRKFRNYDIETALDGRTDYYEPEARADGGSAAVNPTQKSTETAETTTGSWESVYEQYANAGDVDAKKPARYAATELLSENYYWANLEENDTIYAYDDETGIYTPTGEKRVRELLVDNLREEYAKNEKSEILDQLRGRHTVRQDEMGGPANRIPVRNGVLNVQPHGISLEDHNPEHRFLGAVAAVYDPDAGCPQFRSFLDDVVQTETQRKKLQEYAGYTLMHWGLPHHKALFLVGPTASGKSTFLDTIRAVLGDDTVVSLTPQELTGERFAGAELFQSWANFRNDIPSSLIEDTGAFKEITAGDSIKAERKFKDPFRFEPNAKHLFSANQLPDAETEDEAFYRRVLLVPFPSTVPKSERDPHLDEKLQSELSGVLNWMLDGLQRLMAQGEFTGDRTPGETQRTWEKWGHTVDRFREICLQESEGSQLAKSEAYNAYHAFCEAKNLPAETQHKMTRRLKQEGITDGRATIDGKQERVFVGVELTGKGESYLPDESDDEQGRL